MPIVYFVKKARKDNPAVKRGESYYWWKTRITVGKSYVGMKHYSKNYPKRSQLTSSDFYSQLYDIEDDQIARLDRRTTPGELRDSVENIKDAVRDLGEQQQQKFDDMPVGLQEGPTGELLRERADYCEAMADEFENVDLDDYEGPDFDGEGDPPDEMTEWVAAKVEELRDISYEGE